MKINVCTTIICEEGRPTGAWPNNRGSMARAAPNNELSLCCHCHPASGTFDCRDPLVHTIFPNVLNKEVEKNKSEIASSKCDLMARNY